MKKYFRGNKKNNQDLSSSGPIHHPSNNLPELALVGEAFGHIQLPV